MPSSQPFVASPWWAPALLPGEREAAGVPEWARLADRAVATAPVVPPSVGRPRSDAAAAGPDRSRERAAAEGWFAVVVAPFVELVLPADLRPAGFAPSAVADARRTSSALLCRLAARTLVAWLHRAGAAGGLGPGDPAAQFDRFVGTTATRAGLAELFGRFPVLARLLATTAAHHAAAFVELTVRFEADTAAIVDTLLDGVEPGPVVHVRACAGDTHQRGRSVAVLEFAGGRRVVYKPRPLGVHLLFAGLLDRLREHAGDDVPRSAAVVVRPGHGWMEYVAAGPCDSTAEVERFYRRQGLLLAALHAVRATDMHCENLVAAGAHPVLVDLETLLHPDADTASTDDDPARAALRRSVLRTAMLPQWRDGGDLSGFGGDRGPLSGPTGETVGYADAGLASMRLVRRRGDYPGAGNRPVLAGRVAEPADHVAAVVAGFRTGYDALLAERGRLLAPGGLLDALAARPQRVVRRDSAVYARLLDECTHPDVLAEGAARDAVLRQLVDAVGSADPAVVEREVDQLWHGDIPVFVGPAAGGATPARDVVAGLSLVDRERQAWVVAVALAGRRPAAPSGGFRAPRRTHDDLHRSPRPSAPLAAASAIGDRVIADAVTSAGRTNWWCAYRHLDGTGSVLPMGADLGQGYVGVALFLAELGEVTGLARYRDHARRAAAPLPALLAGLAADDVAARIVGPGLFDGLGGIAHVLSRLTVLLPDAGLEPARELAVELTRRSARTDDLSVRAGLAGGVLGLLGAAGASPAAAAAAADLAADLLERSAVATWPHRRSVLGGWPGAVWALARAGRDLDRPELTAGAALLVERLDPLHPGLAARGGAGFDTGVAGLAVVHAAVDARGFLARRLRERLARAAPVAGDDSLGSGLAGTLDVGLQLGTPTGAPLLADLAADLTARAVQGPHDVGCSTPGRIRTAGLLHGWAGIGLVLLRHHDPAAVPSPLTLTGSVAAGRSALTDVTVRHPPTGGVSLPPRGMFR